ncbi:MAG: hypothetical protein DHS20C15_22150 [Planctomycetota bacterium]|nr:MAG: hypothetical protein DHS20C15_22150 [Planctomycetota bacterium]
MVREGVAVERGGEHEQLEDQPEEQQSRERASAGAQQREAHELVFARIVAQGLRVVRGARERIMRTASVPRPTSGGFH